jgi:hypothetical protein
MGKRKKKEYQPWGYDKRQENNDGKPSTNGQEYKTIPNEEWDSPKKEPEVIDLTSPSPAIPSSTNHAAISLDSTIIPSLPQPWSPSQLTPLIDLSDLVSDFDSVASSNSSISDLGNVGDIEV